MPKNPAYPESRTRGLKPRPENLLNAGPPLQPGEVTEKPRVRLSEEDWLWFKPFTAAEKGQAIAWARAQGWQPQQPEPDEEEEEEQL